MILDLTDVETDALAGLLRRTIDDDRYPLSPRVQTLKAILAKIQPERRGSHYRRLSDTRRRERRRPEGGALAVETGSLTGPITLDPTSPFA